MTTATCHRQLPGCYVRTCNLWRQAAEKAAETLGKGMRAIVTGRPRQRTYQVKDGGTASACRVTGQAGPRRPPAPMSPRRSSRPSAQLSGWLS